MAKGQSNAVEPKARTGQGVLIKCHGQYYYRDERQKGIKHYIIDVKAPSLSFFQESTKRYVGLDDDSKPKYEERVYLNVRGVLKKRLLPVLLRKKFMDFARIRFVTIDEIVSLTGEELDLPLTLRSKTQLQELINQKKMPIDPDEYLEIDELRTDILEYQTDADAFLKRKPKKDIRRQEERAFMEMNELTETLPPVKETKQKASAPVVKPSTSTGRQGIADDEAFSD